MNDRNGNNKKKGIKQNSKIKNKQQTFFCLYIFLDKKKVFDIKICNEKFFLNTSFTDFTMLFGMFVSSDIHK